MKALYLISTIFLAALAIFSNVYPARAQTINPPKQQISLAGSPFAVTTTPTDPGYNAPEKKHENAN